MATGTVTFVAPVIGLQLETVEVSNSLPTVDKITMETKDGGLIEIVFHLTEVFTIEDAEDIVNPILASIIDRLAFDLDVSIGEPHLLGATLPKDASASAFTAMTSRRISYKILAPDAVPDVKKREALATLLAQPYSHPELYAAYRFACTQSDAIARYMFLYNILLQLHGDAQTQVDDFIRREEPSVPESRSPFNANVMETVYTRLRNEVGHTRVGTTPEQTRKGMEDNLAALQALARTAIDRVV